MFWPDAYRDLHGYALWPQAYGRRFWGPAFNDVFAGIFWPPGIAANQPVGRASETVGRATDRGGDSNHERADLSPEFARICDDKAVGLTDRSFEHFARAIQPSATQQVALDELRSASAKAIEILRAQCPTETPPTVTERLDAITNRLAAMLDAVGTVRPALYRFYNSLTNEQKAHFNRVSTRMDFSQRGSLHPVDHFAGENRCAGESAPGFRNRTIQRIERVVRPTSAQRAALDELRTASTKAAKMLDVRCFGQPPLTPTGRLDAIGQRLVAMLRAVKTMAPAMAKFYAMLNDEQKARLNTMRDLSQ